MVTSTRPARHLHVAPPNRPPSSCPAAETSCEHVWSDSRIGVGDAWATEIARKIADAGAFIVVMSGEEPTTEVQYEIDWAKRKNRQFFPISRDGSQYFRVSSTQACEVRGDELPGPQFIAALHLALK